LPVFIQGRRFLRSLGRVVWKEIGGHRSRKTTALLYF
jgi:hypothetical protein